MSFMGILMLMLILFGYGVVSHAALQDMRGRAVNLGESVQVGLDRAVPLLGVLILLGLGVWLGCLLLVIPGIMLAVRWYIAVPVCVVERLGGTSALGRSAELTKGHRWKIFGLMLIVGFGGGIAGAVLGGIAALGGLVVSLIVQFVVQVVAAAFGAVLATVIYHDLRVAKEGVDTDRIASVFD